MVRTTYLVFKVSKQGEQAKTPVRFLPNDTTERAMRAAKERGLHNFNLVERVSALCSRSDHHMHA